MGNRLSSKFRKGVRDLTTKVKKEGAPRRHKIAKERSKKALARKAYPAV